MTVRKATGNLVAQGLLTRVAGVETFVRHPHPQFYSGLFRGYAESRYLSPHRSSYLYAPKCTCQHCLYLGIETGESIYFIERIRYASNNIFQFETTYMSSRLYPDISIQVLQSSKYQYIEKEKGLKITYSSHAVTPLHPSKRIAELFDIPLDTPILLVANTTYLTNGQVMDYTELTLNSPKYQLTYVKNRTSPYAYAYRDVLSC